MKKILVLTAALFLTLGLLASDSSAQGLLGKRTLSVSFGNLLPGNDTVSSIDDAVVQLDVTCNFPILKHLDAFASAGYSQLKGRFGTDEVLASTSEQKRIDGGVAYQFFPGQEFNPYVKASVGYVSLDAANNATGKAIPPWLPIGGGTENDLAYSFGGGIEVPFAGQFAATPSFTYSAIGDADDFIGGVKVNGWFNQVIFAGAGVSYGFNEGDFTYAGTIGFGF